jgi:HNH endonuclease
MEPHVTLSWGEKNERRRARKFQRQFGICYWFTNAIRNGRKPKCPNPQGLMTLERMPNGKMPSNFATYEHLQRKRDGGAGKPDNVVLACCKCNQRREAGIKTEQPKPENVAAKRMSNDELLRGLRDGTLTDAARGELYTRGLVPNWPMWSKMMAREPLGPH